MIKPENSSRRRSKVGGHSKSTADSPQIRRRGGSRVKGNRPLRWSFVQHGFWVHGVADLRGDLASASLFTLEGRADDIRCPALLTAAGDDTCSGSVPMVMDRLRCPKTLINFTDAEGAGDHCEMMNRSALNRRALDWPDAALGGV